MKTILVAIAFLLFPVLASGQTPVIKLDWAANDEKDLLCYIVYKSDSFYGPYYVVDATTKTVVTGWTASADATTATAISSKIVTYTERYGGLLKNSIYFDYDIEFNRVYWYYVVAVDTAWNESTPSNKAGRMVVDVKPPAPPKDLR